jgi:uncharacterized protein (DUF427 family)
MKIPGPDHPITIKPASGRVRVTFNGKVVADSKRAGAARGAQSRCSTSREMRRPHGSSGR